MPDQLFVNKSESQKEVEDILRWGTEELFSDSFSKEIGENNTSKDETVPDIKQNKVREGLVALEMFTKTNVQRAVAKSLWIKMLS